MKRATVMLVAMVVGIAHSFAVPPGAGARLAPASTATVGLGGNKTPILHGAVSDDFDMVLSDGGPSSIEAAAAFMVESFWLRSPQNLLTGGEVSAVSDGARSSLVRQQVDDLTDKFGERMGKRLLEAGLITAKEKGAEEILGLVAIEARLFDLDKKTVLSSEQSESAVKNAVASLGPKQRRQYKDSAVSEIVAELTPPEITAICVLSNLSVSPRARRRGLGAKLCSEAERIAKEEWGFGQIYLMVEAENDAARQLYEGKLGYELQYIDDEATGVRVDVGAGDFSKVPAATLVLAKKL